MGKKDIIYISLLVAILAALLTLVLRTEVQANVTEQTTTQVTTEITTEETTTDIPLTTVKYEDIPKLRELGTFYITGYTPTCSHCCLKSDGIGASGRKVVVGESVAMNRADMKNFSLEYGDRIYIDGIGERVIVDTGCGQGVIDVACDSHESCYKVTGWHKVRVVIE